MRSPIGVLVVKQVTNNSVGLVLKEATRPETKAFRMRFVTEDQKQAMTAFMEKKSQCPFRENEVDRNYEINFKFNPPMAAV
jgi:enoyl-CoA hydratase/carnithine racemase